MQLDEDEGRGRQAVGRTNHRSRTATGAWACNSTTTDSVTSARNRKSFKCIFVYMGMTGLLAPQRAKDMSMRIHRGQGCTDFR